MTGITFCFLGADYILRCCTDDAPLYSIRRRVIINETLKHKQLLGGSLRKSATHVVSLTLIHTRGRSNKEIDR